MAFRPAALGAWCVVTLAACGLTVGPKGPQQVYDFGPPPVSSAQHQSSEGVVVPIAEGPSWLDSNALTYRLGYVAANQPLSYANSRWAMSPAELLTRQVRNALAVRRSVVANSDGASQTIVRIELEEFAQVFDAPERSRGVVQFRATLTRKGKLLGQRTFAAVEPAVTADAAGGVAALSAASQSAVSALTGWVDEMVP
jgi:cholesterol transport system auxiliary component